VPASGSVVVARLQKVDAVVPDEIDETMFFGQPARPGALVKMTERLGLSDPFEGVAEDRLDQIECPQGSLSVRIHPETEIFQEFLVKDGNPLPSAQRARFGRAGTSPSLFLKASGDDAFSFRVVARLRAARSRAAFFGERSR